MPMINKAQRRAITLLWLRCLEADKLRNRLGSLRAFHRSAYYSYTMGCVMVKWCGMLVGIEQDGYTHT